MKKVVLLFVLLSLLLPSFVFAAEDQPIVVEFDAFHGNFDPFFADSDSDRDAVGMTQLSLLSTDPEGAVIYNGIEGKLVSHEDGTESLYTGPADLSVVYDAAENITTYTAKLREDLTFSDGVPVTADDLIFTYYVLLDPSYAGLERMPSLDIVGFHGGRTKLSSLNIVGLKNYLTQAVPEVYDKYYEIAHKIIDANFEYGNDVPELMTSEMIFQEDMYWISLCRAIVMYCRENYADEYASDYGLDPEEVKTNDGLAIAFGMAKSGFGNIDENGIFTAPGVEWSYDLKEGGYPTLLDFRDVTNHYYKGDANAFYAEKNTGGAEKDILPASVDGFIAKYAAEDAESAGGVPNISGIEKVDDHTVTVKTYGYDPTALYSIFGIPIVPMHYYGDPEQYRYEENAFGHPFGDLSLVMSKSDAPLGAGPFKFMGYQDNVITFEANENYYRGCPDVKVLQFRAVGDLGSVPVSDREGYNHFLGLDKSSQN